MTLTTSSKQMQSLSSKASFSSIRAEAPSTEDGTAENFGYLTEVIERLLPCPLTQPSMELNMGERPLGVDLAINAWMRGESSTGDYTNQEDVPERLRLRPSIKMGHKRKLSRSLENLLAELVQEQQTTTKLNILGGSQDLEPTEFAKLGREEPHESEFPTTTASCSPLKVKPAREKQNLSASPFAWHDIRFPIADAAAISVMSGRSLPSIPESTVEKSLFTEETRSHPESSAEGSSKVPQSTPQSSLDIDPEAHVHPAYRTRNRSNSPPLILYEGASKYLQALSSRNLSQHDIAQSDFARDVQASSSAYIGLKPGNIPFNLPSSQPNVDQSLFHGNVQASPPSYVGLGSGNTGPPSRFRPHHSNSTPELTPRTASGFPPRHIQRTQGFTNPDNASLASNTLGIHSSSSTNHIALNTSHTARVGTDVHHNFPLRDPDFSSSGIELRTGRQHHLDVIPEAQAAKRKKASRRSQSVRDNRIEHNEGVQQFNKKHLRSVSSGHELGKKPSFVTPPQRPARPLSLSATNLSTLHAQSQPYTFPLQPYIYPVHPYPQLPSHPYPQLSHPYPQQSSMYPQPLNPYRERMQTSPAPLELGFESEDDDADSTTVEAGGSEYERALAEVQQQSAVEKIAKVLGKEAAVAHLAAKGRLAVPPKEHESIAKGLVGEGKKMMRWMRGKK